MSNPQEFKAYVRDFIQAYASLFASSDASDPERVGALAELIGRFYRPGMTMFTNGQVSRFESQAQAAALIEHEMRNNITTGLGTKLILEEIEKVEVYSENSAVCWLRWRFEPAKGSEFEGRGWGFVGVYGFRAGSRPGDGDGWEFVLRDQEVENMRAVTGRTFE